MVAPACNSNRLRQENYFEFKANLDYLIISRLKTPKQRNKKPGQSQAWGGGGRKIKSLRFSWAADGVCQLWAT